MWSSLLRKHWRSPHESLPCLPACPPAGPIKIATELILASTSLPLSGAPTFTYMYIQIDSVTRSAWAAARALERSFTGLCTGYSFLMDLRMALMVVR